MIFGPKLIPFFQVVKLADALTASAAMASTTFHPQQQYNPNWEWYQEKSFYSDEVLNQLVEVGMEEVRDAITSKVIELEDTTDHNLSAKSANDISTELRNGGSRYASLARIGLLYRDTLSRPKALKPIASHSLSAQEVESISQLITDSQFIEVTPAELPVVAHSQPRTLRADYEERIRSLQEYVEANQVDLPRLSDVKLPDASTFVEAAMLKQRLEALDKQLAELDQRSQPDTANVVEMPSTSLSAFEMLIEQDRKRYGFDCAEVNLVEAPSTRVIMA